MRIYAGLVGPKIENMHATAGRSKFLKGQMRGDVVKEPKHPAVGIPIRGYFGVTLPTLESLWDHFGYIKVILEIVLVRFQKNSHFPLDFNDFIQL